MKKREWVWEEKWDRYMKKKKEWAMREIGRMRGEREIGRMNEERSGERVSKRWKR